MTVRKSFEVGGYAVYRVRIELNIVGAQRRRWPKRPCGTWALERDTTADIGVAAKGKEGERWEVAEPVHDGLLLRSGCYALLVCAWLWDWWSCSARLYDHVRGIDCIA